MRGEASSQSTALSPYAQIRASSAPDDDLPYRQQGQTNECLQTLGNRLWLLLFYGYHHINCWIWLLLGIQDKDFLLHGTKKSKKGMRKGLAGDDALPSAGPLSVKGESYTLTLYGIWLLVSTLSE
jgi:hypothetical protein